MERARQLALSDAFARLDPLVAALSPLVIGPIVTIAPSDSIATTEAAVAGPQMTVAPTASPSQPFLIAHSRCHSVCS